MRRDLMCIGLIAGSALVAALVGIAGAHRATYATVVVEENASRSPRPDYKVIGHLESSKEACLRNRIMKFLARTEDGATVVLGTDRTSDSGRWKLVGDNTMTHGERLKVTQKSLPRRHHHRRVCQAASTKLLA